MYGGTGSTAITGTGSNVLSISPTFTGTVNVAALTASGIISGIGSGLTTLNATNISSGAVPVLYGGTGSTAITGTGSNVLSISPTFTGTVNVAALTASGIITGNGSGLTYLDMADATNTGILPVARGGTGTTLFTGTGSNVFSISPTFTGTVGAAALTATGTVTASTFNATSDSNFKTDIKDLPVDYSINLLNKLNPKSYRLLNDSNNIRFGFIAQEVQHILDEPLGLHCINENSTQSICYQELIAPLVSVTNSLLARNEELTKRVCDLEQLVSSLK